MKISIEDTTGRKVELTVSDEINVESILEEMKNLLIAYGYPKEAINSCFEVDD